MFEKITNFITFADLPIKKKFLFFSLGILFWFVTLFIMGIAAAEAAIALSIIIAVYRNYRTIDTDDVAELKG